MWTIDSHIESNLKIYESLSKKIKDEIDRDISFKKANVINYVSRCESPIEQLLAIRLMDLEPYFYKELSVLSGFKFLSILPQKEVVVNDRKYRLDFLIECLVDNKKHLFAIECDGHEFHEKTKKQAARDKARERNLMSKGYKIIRFTGSEIWNDPGKCASDIVDIVQNSVGLDDYYQKLIEEGQYE